MNKIFWTLFLFACLAAPGGDNTQKIAASAPLTLTAGVMAIPVATSSANGYLSLGDWTLFNSKQAAGSYITALTGDVTASGPGSSAASIAATTVTGKLLTNFLASAGTVSATDSILTAFNKIVANMALLAPLNNPTFTGTIGTPLTSSRALITDGSGNLSVSSVTATTLAFMDATSSVQTQLNAKQASGNYITALTGDVSASGPGSASASIGATTVTGKVLTGFSSGAGTVAATDTILQGFNKVVGNMALLAPLASPTFSGTITTPLTASRAVFTDGSSALTANAVTGSGNVVMSASPTLTGTAALASATFSGSAKSGNYHMEPLEHDDGNSGTAQTIDWSVSSSHLSTLTGNVTYTFSAPQSAGTYVLRIATGAGAFTMTWPGTVSWLNSTATSVPVGSVSKMALVSFYYDGATYWGNYATNY